MIVASPIWEHGRVQKNPRLAFAIMPFRPKWSSYVYNEFIKAAAVDAGLIPQRGDEMTGRNVLQDIWQAIYSCRLVIADLTEPNANVYYELGIAHTLGKKAILLTQNVDAVPFDLRQQRLIVYSDDDPGHKKLQIELAQHLGAVLAEPVDEIYFMRTIVGGYIVEAASLLIDINGDDHTSGSVVDDMTIVGTRENVVLLNKVIEHSGRVTGVASNHRCVRSTEYADVVRMAALFNEPYVQIGTRERVRFEIGIDKGFSGEQRRWNYDIAVECSRLEWELRAPLDFTARVRLAQYVKPTDHDLQVIVPDIEEGSKVYRAIVPAPEVGHVYALVWY